jgi:hypothetical protein
MRSASGCGIAGDRGASHQLPEIAAAAPFVRVLGELFAPDPESGPAAIGLPVVPLEELYGPPAESYLNARNGRIIRKVGAKVIVDASPAVRGVRARATRSSTHSGRE